MRMLAEAESERDKRHGIVKVVAEVEEARAESAWLLEYELDEQRFKVGGLVCPCAPQYACKPGSMPHITYACRSGMHARQQVCHILTYACDTIS